MKTLCLIALMLASSSVFAADAGFDHVQIDNNACTVVHSGTRNAGVIWRGEKNYGMCHVTVDTQAFSRKYSFCALSGAFSEPGKPVMCEFGYYNREKTKLSFASSAGSLCQYVCVRH